MSESDNHTLSALTKEAIILGQKTTTLHQVVGMRPAVVAPKEFQLLPLAKDTDKLARPRFLTACPAFNDMVSFVAYVNDFKDRATRLFYKQDGTFLAVFDYHEPAAPGIENAAAPLPLAARHGDHCATLALLRSPEWEAWANNSSKPMGQVEFAEFLEDNAADVVSPDITIMMAAATGLQASTNGTFKQACNLANGTVQILFDEQVNGQVAGREASIPTEFKIGVRPFMGCDRYEVDCRFRYRARNAELKLHYKALRMEWVTETALEKIVHRVFEETGIVPALGVGNVAELKKGT